MKTILSYTLSALFCIHDSIILSCYDPAGAFAFPIPLEPEFTFGVCVVDDFSAFVSGVTLFDGFGCCLANVLTLLTCLLACDGQGEEGREEGGGGEEEGGEEEEEGGGGGGERVLLCAVCSAVTYHPPPPAASVLHSGLSRAGHGPFLKKKKKKKKKKKHFMQLVSYIVHI